MQHPPTLGRRRRLLFAFWTTILLFGLTEFTARLVESRLSRVPPALVEALQGMGWQPNVADKRLLRENPNTLWALEPNYVGALPSYVEGGADWSVRIGPHGYRGAAPATATAGPRIACVGNSCTFGLLVDQGETYPEQLATALADQGERVEVLNYGIPGFTSEQGRWILEHDVLPARPDLVILAFGFNDGWPAQVSDRERLRQTHSKSARWRRGLRTLALFRLLEARLQRRPAAPDAPLENAPLRGRRVSTTRLAENLHFMIAATEATGARVLLLALDFPTGGAVEVLSRVAADAAVPFVDARSAYAGGCSQTPLPQVVRALSIARPNGPREADGADDTASKEILIEVAAPSSVPRPIGVVGNIAALGNGVPGKILLADNGQGADQQAGDGVYALSAQAPAGREVHYLFTCGTAGDSLPRFESAVAVRTLRQDAGLLRFGRLPLMAEAIHPAATGCQAIAWLIADAIDQHDLLTAPRNGGGDS
jgi:lysophospholipase L1-like esterase